MRSPGQAREAGAALGQTGQQTCALSGRDNMKSSMGSEMYGIDWRLPNREWANAAAAYRAASSITPGDPGRCRLAHPPTTTSPFLLLAGLICLHAVGVPESPLNAMLA